MKQRYFSGWIIGSLALILNVSSVAMNRQPGFYREHTLIATGYDFSALGLKNCQSARALDTTHYLAACRQTSPKATSALRLFLVDTRQPEQNAILFRSSDFGDAYYVKVTVFNKDQGDGPIFILAESGAEFSYGVQIYMLDGSELRSVGNIDEVLLDDEENASSVVPALQIKDTGQTVVFSFTKNVIVPDRQGNYTTVTPERIRYIFDGRTLRRLLSNQ
ncbi:MAG TPA: hypothetical protein PLD30_03730 [Candidatus Competibacteraceae bacterium]|nr:hypothetical protein [Candidatus Competibacteraceae bacterium]